jgi:hypothetical protein
MPSARSASVVAEHGDVLLGQMRGVDGGKPRAEQAVPLQQRRGRQPGCLQACLVFGRLLGEVDVQRNLRGQLLGDDRKHLGGDAAHRMQRGTHGDLVRAELP